jgi:retron-type reverse transcriptase
VATLTRRERVRVSPRRTPRVACQGDTRPIGIPTFEDKVLQREVVMVREVIYEQDFHDGSYGLRNNTER